jgi:leucyl-tRNA synthetase
MDYQHHEIALKYKNFHRESSAQDSDFFCDVTKAKSPYYALGMFPYPSGNAHMGHVRVYTLTDIKARFKKSLGEDVLHPMGWDSFGLPAENAAIQNKVRPDWWTEKNIVKMKTDQLANVGWSFDWDKELNTSSPEYYQWTQWLFLQMYRAGIAYKKADFVNWCEIDQTVLANEQVIDGRCWRDGSVVEKKMMEQWFFRITDYAERLWNDISKLKNWAPEAVSVQKNWINQKRGAYIDFLRGEEAPLTVFTTRPDTLFGVTALVIAPEHQLVQELIATSTDTKLVSYVKEAMKKSVVDRMQSKEKTGVATGLTVQHPLLKDLSIPLWVGDYVIADFGTGVVMCVPAHDTRDFEFAAKFGLPIQQVIHREGLELPLKDAYVDEGIMINSGEFNGMTSEEARLKIVARLHELKRGKETTTYQLKDWSVGRQRFWGCPIPMIKCAKCGDVEVPESALPVKLPEISDKHMGEGRLSLKDFPEFVHTTCPKCQGQAERETDTLDTFLCSSWYAFRFVDNKNTKNIFDTKSVDRFMPIHFYVGGLEHAAQHMIYFRFMTKVLFDQKLIHFDEPVDHFFANGMVKMGGQKMSKSKGNVVIPTEAINQFGADAVRFYMMSDTPAELDIDWDEAGLQAKYDFIRKNFMSLSQLLETVKESSIKRASYSNQEALYDFYKALEAYKGMIENNQFHSAVAQVHVMSNALLREINRQNHVGDDRKVLRTLTHEFLVAAGIMMPMFTEVLLREFFGDVHLFLQPFPATPEEYRQKNTVTVVVQMNGKKKATLELPRGIGQAEAEVFAMKDEAVLKALEGKAVKKLIYVQDRILNIVV